MYICKFWMWTKNVAMYLSKNELYTTPNEVSICLTCNPICMIHLDLAQPEQKYKV
jgi:hypothetical protein